MQSTPRLTTQEALTEARQRDALTRHRTQATCTHALSVEGDDRPGARVHVVTFTYPNGQQARYDGRTWAGPRREEAGFVAG